MATLISETILRVFTEAIAASIDTWAIRRRKITGRTAKSVYTCAGHVEKVVHNVRLFVVEHLMEGRLYRFFSPGSTVAPLVFLGS